MTESLYALCRKYQSGFLTLIEFDQAVLDLVSFMKRVSHSPINDFQLIPRIHQIGKGYGCSRSADGAYIALAEELAKLVPTALITFDQELPKQVASNAPTVNVHLL